MYLEPFKTSILDTRFLVISCIERRKKIFFKALIKVFFMLYSDYK